MKGPIFIVLDYESNRVKKYIHPFFMFNIPGLVAMNHPDHNPNGASSEFFILPFKDIGATRVKDLMVSNAPFVGFTTGPGARSVPVHSLDPGRPGYYTARCCRLSCVVRR